MGKAINSSLKGRKEFSGGIVISSPLLGDVSKLDRGDINTNGNSDSRLQATDGTSLLALIKNDDNNIITDYGINNNGISLSHNENWNNSSGFLYPTTIMEGDFTSVGGVNKTVLETDQQLWTLFYIVRSVVTVMGISSILLNICFLIVMQCSHESTSPFHRFIKNLSLSDILASLLFLVTQNFPQGPFSYIRKESVIISELLPYIFRGLPWMFFTTYFMTLTCLSINQYIAVCKPWKYSYLASPRIIIAGICFVWILASLQVIVPSLVLLILARWSDNKTFTQNLFLISKVEMQVWMGIFLGLTFTSIILNSMIYQKIREMKWKRRHSMNSQESINIKMKQEAFLTISLLLATAILFRLPVPIMSIVILEVDRHAISDKSFLIINAILLLLLYVNFFTDTIIYTIRVKEARKIYKIWCKRVFCCCRIRQSGGMCSFQLMPQGQNAHVRRSITSTYGGTRIAGAGITDRIELSSSIAENVSLHTKNIDGTGDGNTVAEVGHSTGNVDNIDNNNIVDSNHIDSYTSSSNNCVRNMQYTDNISTGLLFGDLSETHNNSSSSTKPCD